MLTFITLSCQTGSAMPAVSYIMASEVWFVACTAFIFGSLVEFAFVNIICRRRQVQLNRAAHCFVKRGENKCSKIWNIFVHNLLNAFSIVLCPHCFLCYCWLIYIYVNMCKHIHKSNTHMHMKVKFTLEQATKAQRGSRSVALLFL